MISPLTLGLPARRCAATTYGRATKAGNFAYYGRITTVTTNAVYRYDFAANTWATMAPLQTARTSRGFHGPRDGCKLYAVWAATATFFTAVLLPVTVGLMRSPATVGPMEPVVTKAERLSGEFCRPGDRASGVDGTTYHTVQVAPVTARGGADANSHSNSYAYTDSYGNSHSHSHSHSPATATHTPTAR